MSNLQVNDVHVDEKEEVIDQKDIELDDSKEEENAHEESSTKC